MTEYKKCISLIEEVTAATEKLRDVKAIEINNFDSIKSLLDRFDDDVVPNLRVRASKLLAKAREKDPDKQIYNESMCQKIEDLFLEVEKACAMFESVAPAAHELYVTHLRARVAEQHLHQTLIRSTAEVVAKEVDERRLLMYDFMDSVRALAGRANADYEVALEKKKRREEMEWRAEQARRQEEMNSLDELVRGVELHAAQQKAPLGLVAMNAVRQRLGESADISVLRRLASLVEGVTSDPSGANVRLRNNNSTTLEHFGHPFAVAVAADDLLGQASAEGARRTYEAAELLLAVAGYRPYYELVGGFGVPIPPKNCGWRVGPTPWERYAERFLELREPDPSASPQEWMEWHERLSGLRHSMQMFLKDFRR